MARTAGAAGMNGPEKTEEKQTDGQKDFAISDRPFKKIVIKKEELL